MEIRLLGVPPAARAEALAAVNDYERNHMAGRKSGIRNSVSWRKPVGEVVVYHTSKAIVAEVQPVARHRIVWELADRLDSRYGGYAISRLYVGTRNGKRVATIRGTKSGVSTLHWSAQIEGLCPLESGGSDGFDRMADAKAWVAKQCAGLQQG